MISFDPSSSYLEIPARPMSCFVGEQNGTVGQVLPVIIKMTGQHSISKVALQESFCKVIAKRQHSSENICRSIVKVMTWRIRRVPHRSTCHWTSPHSPFAFLNSSTRSNIHPEMVFSLGSTATPILIEWWSLHVPGCQAH